MHRGFYQSKPRWWLKAALQKKNTWKLDAAALGDHAIFHGHKVPQRFQVLYEVWHAGSRSAFLLRAILPLMGPQQLGLCRKLEYQPTDMSVPVARVFGHSSIWL